MPSSEQYEVYRHSEKREAFASLVPRPLPDFISQPLFSTAAR